MLVTISEFKAKCLGMVDTIRHSGETVIITKHGKPVAKLTPYAATQSLFGCLKGQIQCHDDVVASDTDDAWSHWNEERNL